MHVAQMSAFHYISRIPLQALVGELQKAQAPVDQLRIVLRVRDLAAAPEIPDVMQAIFNPQSPLMAGFAPNARAAGAWGASSPKTRLALCLLYEHVSLSRGGALLPALLPSLPIFLGDSTPAVAKRALTVALHLIPQALHQLSVLSGGAAARGRALARWRQWARRRSDYRDPAAYAEARAKAAEAARESEEGFGLDARQRFADGNGAALWTAVRAVATTSARLLGSSPDDGVRSAALALAQYLAVAASDPRGAADPSPASAVPFPRTPERVAPLTDRWAAWDAENDPLGENDVAASEATTVDLDVDVDMIDMSNPDRESKGDSFLTRSGAGDGNATDGPSREPAAAQWGSGDQQEQVSQRPRKPLSLRWFPAAQTAPLTAAAVSALGAEAIDAISAAAMSLSTPEAMATSSRALSAAAHSAGDSSVGPTPLVLRSVVLAAGTVLLERPRAAGSLVAALLAVAAAIPAASARMAPEDSVKLARALVMAMDSVGKVEAGGRPVAPAAKDAITAVLPALATKAESARPQATIHQRPGQPAAPAWESSRMGDAAGPGGAGPAVPGGPAQLRHLHDPKDPAVQALFSNLGSLQKDYINALVVSGLGNQSLRAAVLPSLVPAGAEATSSAAAAAAKYSAPWPKFLLHPAGLLPGDVAEAEAAAAAAVAAGKPAPALSASAAAAAAALPKLSPALVKFLSMFPFGGQSMAEAEARFTSDMASSSAAAARAAQQAPTLKTPILPQTKQVSCAF